MRGKLFLDLLFPLKGSNQLGYIPIGYNHNPLDDGSFAVRIIRLKIDFTEVLTSIVYFISSVIKYSIIWF